MRGDVENAEEAEEEIDKLNLSQCVQSKVQDYCLNFILFFEYLTCVYFRNLTPSMVRFEF